MRSFCIVCSLVLLGCDLLAQPHDPDAFQEINDRYERVQAERIAGRENEPAGEVFRNMRIEWLKSVPARQLLGIMNGGYARALGVRCTYCHVEQDFASDEKRPKRAAREMALMHWNINQALAQMENLETPSQERFINCATCHRGRRDPRDSAPGQGSIR